jgi:hypothetical protein
MRARDQPAASVHAQAERVPRRVQEHPEGRAGLVLVLGRAELEHGRLGGVEVVRATARGAVALQSLSAGKGVRKRA